MYLIFAKKFKVSSTNYGQMSIFTIFSVSAITVSIKIKVLDHRPKAPLKSHTGPPTTTFHGERRRTAREI
jgi:hypothetical protein